MKWLCCRSFSTPSIFLTVYDRASEQTNERVSEWVCVAICSVHLDSMSFERTFKRTTFFCALAFLMDLAFNRTRIAYPTLWLPVFGSSYGTEISFENSIQCHLVRRQSPHSIAFLFQEFRQKRWIDLLGKEIYIFYLLNECEMEWWLGGWLALRKNIFPNKQNTRSLSRTHTKRKAISPIFTNKSVANALIRLSLIGNFRLKSTMWGTWLDNYIPTSPTISHSHEWAAAK